MIPGSLSLIPLHPSTKRKRGKAIGTWSSITTVVTIGGPILGGALADAGLWRAIFFINIPLGLLALVILWRKVAETRNVGTKSAVDFAGALAIAFGLALLTFGFLRIPAAGFDNWGVLASLAAGPVLLVCFIVLERRSKNPMMPLHLFANGAFSGTNLLTFFFYAGLGAGMLFLSLNLVQVQGYSQLQSGLTFLPFTLLMISIARWAGGLSDRYGPRILLMAGPATAGLGLLFLSFVGQTHSPSEYWKTFFPGILTLGLGMSFTVAPLTATVMGAVDNHFSGTASGVNNAVSRIASVFANAVFGALAVLFFSGALQQQVNGLPLKVDGRRAVMTEAVNLGNAKVPATVSPADKVLVETAYHLAFIDTYAKIMRISAVLAFFGALMAFIFVKKTGKIIFM